MTTTQLQIRRDSATNLASTTPVVGEIGYDTTNKNLLAGDGARAGGIPHVSYKHDQTQRFHYATAVGGTADAITITLAEPLDAYVAGVAIEFKATASNTGAATINVSSLGVKTLKKMSSGSLADLAAGDISSGGIYRLVYDGTYFQIITLSFDASSIPTSYITAGTAITPSGSQIEFTSIPATVKRITISLDNIGLSAVTELLLNLGTSSSYETSGYSGVTVGSTISVNGITFGTTRPGAEQFAEVILIRTNNNLWSIYIRGRTWDSSSNYDLFNGVWNKTLSAELTRLRIIPFTGGRTFTGGTAKIFTEL
jgi:hypothetical protein